MVASPLAAFCFPRNQVLLEYRARFPTLRVYGHSYRRGMCMSLSVFPPPEFVASPVATGAEGGVDA